MYIYTYVKYIHTHRQVSHGRGDITFCPRVLKVFKQLVLPTTEVFNALYANRSALFASSPTGNSRECCVASRYAIEMLKHTK